MSPSADPSSCSPRANTVRHACVSGSVAANDMNAPTRRAVCARATPGHATVAPPKKPDKFAFFQQLKLYSVPAKRSRLQDIELAVVSQEAILEPGRLAQLSLLG